MNALEDGEAPVDEAVLAQAVEWYVRLASGTQTREDERAFSCWVEASPEHARAWTRMEKMGGFLRGSRVHLPPPLARGALARAAALPRRRALKTLGWAGCGAVALALLQRETDWGRALAGGLADLSTAVGERREVVLEDGSLLQLNTASAVDLRFDAGQRGVLLRRGEIMVATARDDAGRPFWVDSADGRMQPLGTRFGVRLEEGGAGTRVVVVEGAVMVSPADEGAAVLVGAGQALRFGRAQAGGGVPELADEVALLWTEGAISAQSMRLDAFIADLARYRSGRLRCAPEVAALRITGVWPLVGGDPTEAVLASLERRLPVRVARFTRYWVTVGPV
ncbi:DUF4880 domain-containing protein [Azoarcus indigens]|uniref:FecR family protein n=1 Tax=Azoarcus indigens TaxID=29545 RepID=A0A4R6DD63_9RHOO|nr:FecR domain-containing protein [Azoarcus indigens]NMG68112.1 DUF4880 domain-containing protein [Azoarcus indigens]TDN42485.1 FecR family protein [Azoarcus indigens]